MKQRTIKEKIIFSGKGLQEGKDAEVTLLPQESGTGIVFSRRDIELARAKVLSNLDLMKNTRSTASSRHLAGFHRYPELEPLHSMMTNHPLIKAYMTELCGQSMRTIGLSDITINRSQQWHKDLLRGKYEHLMGVENPCSNSHGLAYKVILYLQDSTSLKVLTGSHKQDIPLGNDKDAIPCDSSDIQNIKTKVGDAVIIDICTTHRGSREDDFISEAIQQNPKILISTVFGAANSKFINSMETGNAIRMGEWMTRNQVYSFES